MQFLPIKTRPLNPPKDDLIKIIVVGIGIYSYGFVPLNDERGTKDIFGKELKITQINVIDAISAMAVYLMGEGAQTQPIVIGRDIPGIQYSLEKGLYEKMVIEPENNLFGILLKPLTDKLG